jgi:hypothetical protein
MKSIAGKITYSMKGPRDPEKGSADCSSTVNWAVKKATGVDIGNSTVAQYTNPNLSTVWYDNGKYASEIPAGTQPNDLLFFARPNSAFTEGRTDRVGHVEIYQGDGKMIGHGSGYGPKEQNVPLGSKGYLVKVARVKQAGANSGIIRNYQQLANVSGGSSGILINSRVGSRNYMTPTNFMGYSGGDSALAYETTNMLNGAKERIKRSNGIDPKLVAQLLEAITKLLNGISDNTAPVKSIYELLKVKMATGGDSGLGNNSSKPTVINNNKIVTGGDSEVDEGISTLVGVLAELAKG